MSPASSAPSAPFVSPEMAFQVANWVADEVGRGAARRSRTADAAMAVGDERTGIA
jgi:hypothetical protein